MKEYRAFLSQASGQYDLAAPVHVIPHPTAQSTTVNLGVISEGVHFLVITAVDQAGNMSGLSNEISFNYDGPPANVTITITVP